MVSPPPPPPKKKKNRLSTFDPGNLIFDTKFLLSPTITIFLITQNSAWKFRCPSRRIFRVQECWLHMISYQFWARALFGRIHNPRLCF